MWMNNKLERSWLMISISIEICDSVLRLLWNVIPFSIYCCHIEYIVGCNETEPPEKCQKLDLFIWISHAKIFSPHFALNSQRVEENFSLSLRKMFIICFLNQHLHKHRFCIAMMQLSEFLNNVCVWQQF